MIANTEQRWAEAQGARIAYYEGGNADGPPVVLLHGGGTDHAMLSWADAIPALINAGYHVYAPDYPGYGSSPADPRPATMLQLIAYLEGLMNAWSLETAALVGISMGGGMALGYTLKHPERVSRLILIGPYGIQDRAPLHRMSYFLVRMGWLNDLMWWPMRRSKWAARYSLEQIVRNPKARTDALVDAVFEAMQNPASQNAFGQFQLDEVLWNSVRTNYSERLHEIKVPVLLVHGTDDIGVPVAAAKQAAERLLNVQLELIEGAGHWTQRDEAERFNRLMLDFLKRSDPT